MFRRIGLRLGYANVMSTLALFIALGGISYAATTLPAKSVGTPQLQNRAVTATKLAGNVVTSSKVRDGSLRARDFAKGQLPAGAVGARGPKVTRVQTGRAGPQTLSCAAPTWEEAPARSPARQARRQPGAGSPASRYSTSSTRASRRQTREHPRAGEAASDAQAERSAAAPCTWSAPRRDPTSAEAPNPQ